MVAGVLIDDPELAVKKALVDLRALLICNSMLQRINSVSCPDIVPRIRLTDRTSRTTLSSMACYLI
jgi:hypothetical protein